MLVRLLYASRAVSPIRPDTLGAIAAKAMPNNAALGVTGLLCHGEDVFLQVLEGGRAEVSTLYNRIACDPRHRDVTLLAYEEIAERDFAGWAMGQVNLNRLNPSMVLKYSEKTALDPYVMPGKAALALLGELVETGSVACPT
jgi:hypothetical protein